MKKEDVTIGGTYSAKVGSRTLDVRIDSENAKGGWNGTAVESGKPVRIKDARNIRGATAADGDRTVEPADEAEAAGEGDPVPTAQKKRGGKKAKAAKPPRAKAPKEKKPKRSSE